MNWEGAGVTLTSRFHITYVFEYLAQALSFSQGNTLKLKQSIPTHNQIYVFKQIMVTSCAQKPQVSVVLEFYALYIYSGNICIYIAMKCCPDASHVYFTCIFIESCSATIKYNSRFGFLRKTNSDSCKFNLYFEKKFFCWIYTCIQKDVYMQEEMNIFLHCKGI